MDVFFFCVSEHACVCKCAVGCNTMNFDICKNVEGNWSSCFDLLSRNPTCLRDTPCFRGLSGCVRVYKKVCEMKGCLCELSAFKSCVSDALWIYWEAVFSLSGNFQTEEQLTAGVNCVNYV